MNNRLLRTQRRRPDAPRILTVDSVMGITWMKPANWLRFAFLGKWFRRFGETVSQFWGN